MSSIFATPVAPDKITMTAQPASKNVATPPTFTRPSTAYKQDGTMVATGVPRYESMGKNLLNMLNFKSVDKANASAHITELTSNSLIISQSSHIWVYIKTTPGATYTLQLNAKCLDASAYKILEPYHTNSISEAIYTNWTFYDNWFPGIAEIENHFSYTFTALGDYLVFLVPSGNNGFALNNIQLEQGSTATAYEPYQEGIMVEEGTMNLMPVASQNKLINGTPNVTSTAITSGLIQGGSYTLSGNKCIFTDDETVLPRVNLMFSYSDNTYSNNVLANIPKDGSFHDFVVSAKADSTKTLTSIRWFLTDYSSGSFMRQEVNSCKLEAKPYATSSHPTTRSGESLEIPANALSTTEGTIEFDVIKTIGNYAIYPHLFSFGVDDNNRLLAYYNGDRSILTLSSKNSGGANNLAVYTGLNLNSFHLAMRWDFGTNCLSLWINHVKVKEGVYAGLTTIAKAHIGANLTGTQIFGGLFSNLRISSIARSDAELSNTGQLAVDEWTTWFADFNGSLDAYERSLATAKIASISG